ncbi:V-type ATP synthase subunit C [Isobaculum melis]|uniref:V/A-type H+-transporting ATPase subunit C n=1 Tax=Isobaculum melis TaxID=142588 RepID=A0A1H9TDC6_9LACT|nr:V-type ATP synthase subunit C [Isobaculum melis]SER95161.1 V/A-type H+-transporting ATPase subunit C [Isobaculum melis]
MDQLQFNQMNARLSVYETKLLQGAKFEQMLSATDAAAVIRLLAETEYGDVIEVGASPYEYERILEKELSRVYKMAYDLSPVKGMVDIFALNYDYHHLKVLTKEKLSGKDLNHLLLPITRTPIEQLRQAVFSMEGTGLDGTMAESVAAVFSYFEEYEDVQSIDVIYDRYYLRELRELADTMNDAGASHIVETMIDTINLSTLLRCMAQKKSIGFLNAVLSSYGGIEKQELIRLSALSYEDIARHFEASDYAELISEAVKEIGETGKMTHYDLLKDNFFMSYLKKAKFDVFGPRTLLAYLYAKETEIKNIRMILVGKINHLPEPFIRERMRESYV